MSSIVELIERNDHISFSFEVTPDISDNVINNLNIDPVFFSVTWHAKSHKCKDLDIAPLRVARFLRSKKKHVLLHLSCDMMRKNYLDKVLAMLRENDICNLFVVLGENYDPASSDFKNSKEMITYIRQSTGEYFCIGVAGSPDQIDENEERLQQLKEKVDCGVNFILTQAFFEPDVYKKFVVKCQQFCISVPIIPGIFFFDTYKQLGGFVNLCKIKVSNDLLEHVKNNDNTEPVGKTIIKKIITDLNTELNTKVFHVFTLNKLETVGEFIDFFKMN